ncbi:MAG: hypothetical protein ACP5P4_10150, partial [Steroidobacteraceae bacterium]
MPTASIPAPDQAQSIPSSLDVPAVIAESVNLPAFAETLARASLVDRYAASTGLLVIEPAPATPPALRPRVAT